MFCSSFLEVCLTFRFLFGVGICDPAAKGFGAYDTTSMGIGASAVIIDSRPLEDCIDRSMPSDVSVPRQQRWNV